MHISWRRTLSRVLPVFLVAMALLGTQLAPTVAKRKGLPQNQLLAVADIAKCPDVEPTMKAVAALIDKHPGLPLAAIGDLAYPAGSRNAFENCYATVFGKFDNRLYPTPGNHEYYDTCPKPPAPPSPTCGQAQAYFTYLKRPGIPAVVQAGKQGWYSYPVGSWRIFVLNTNGNNVAGAEKGQGCGIVSCERTSEQGRWLKAELAKYPMKCTLAYWHHPLFNSGSDGGQSSLVKPLWDMLQESGAELILNGHAHDFEYFEPRLSSGVKDPNGIAQIVIGTGGPVDPMLDAPQQGATFGEIRIGSTPGILKLVLGKDTYRWEFIGTKNTVLAHGKGTCH